MQVMVRVGVRHVVVMVSIKVRECQCQSYVTDSPRKYSSTNVCVCVCQCEHVNDAPTWLQCHHSFVCRLLISLCPDSRGQEVHASITCSTQASVTCRHCHVEAVSFSVILFFLWFFCSLNFQVRTHTYPHTTANAECVFYELWTTKRVAVAPVR